VCIPDLVFPGFQADIVAELEHASESIVEHSNPLFAQGEVQNHHAEMYDKHEQESSAG
jgi:hypothetical protein